MDNKLISHIEYYPNGNVKVKGQKNYKRQFEGIWEWFYENGNIGCRISYIDGKEDGIEQGFDEQGNITLTQLWKDGELIE